MRVACLLAEPSTPQPVSPPLGEEEENMPKVIEAAFLEAIEAVGLGWENWEFQFQEEMLLMSPPVPSPESTRGETDKREPLSEAKSQLQIKEQEPFWKVLLPETWEGFSLKTQETPPSGAEAIFSFETGKASSPKTREFFTLKAQKITSARTKELFFPETQKIILSKTKETFSSEAEEVTSSEIKESLSSGTEGNSIFQIKKCSFPGTEEITFTRIEEASLLTEPSPVQEPGAEEDLAACKV